MEVLKGILIKEIINPIIIILIAILVYLVIKKVINKIFNAAAKRVSNKKQETLKTFFINIVRYVIIIIAFLMILEVYGIDTKAILASIGVMSVVLGLALQDMIKDFVSGVAIVLDDAYNVGDWVTINSFKGEVISLGMKTTRIKSYEGDILVINNGSITQVINHSVNNSMAIVDINVAYSTDLDKCEKVLQEFCKNVEKEIPTLKGEVKLLGVEKLDDSAVVFRIVAEVEPTTQFQTQRIIKKLAKQELDKNNIEIPYPQVVVHNE